MKNKKKILLVIIGLLFGINSVLLMPKPIKGGSPTPPTSLGEELEGGFKDLGKSGLDWLDYTFNPWYEGREGGQPPKKQMWETITYNLDLLTTKKLGALPSDYDRHPSVIIARLVIIVLNFLAALFIILMVYAGFSWMFAGGNEERVSKARDIVKDSIIGAILVFGAYAVTYFILQSLTSAIY
jgi:hypothetical protein